MAGVMTTPPPEPEGLEPRVAALEDGQESMSERIDRILGILDKPGTESDPPVTSADPAPAADMAEQMRQAVRDVHAERDQAKPEPPKPEVPPREAGQPARTRAQRLLYGKEAGR